MAVLRSSLPIWGIRFYAFLNKVRNINFVLIYFK
jgi:hypothetical protein